VKGEDREGPGRGLSAGDSNVLGLFEEALGALFVVGEVAIKDLVEDCAVVETFAMALDDAVNLLLEVLN